MNELQIVDSRKVLGKDFTIYGTVDEPLFKADEVAKWIEHSNASVMLNSVDEAEKQLLTVGTLNNSYSAWFLTEDGLYEVLMQSRKPIAKEFKGHVKEILKSIRKHGAYMTPATLEAAILNPDTMIKILTALKEEQDKSRALQARAEKDKPKVLFAEALEVSSNTILIGELAKLLKQNGVEIGQNRLFQWLRDNGYLMTKGESKNMPTQYSMGLGLFEIKVRTINNPDGSLRETKTPKVTGKGQVYFVNKFLEEKQAS